VPVRESSIAHRPTTRAMPEITGSAASKCFSNRTCADFTAGMTGNSTWSVVPG
jgi:hypothetical protein